MTVESNYAIAVVMLSDWLCENSHASFSTHHKENQNQLLVLSKLQVTAGNSD